MLRSGRIVLGVGVVAAVSAAVVAQQPPQIGIAPVTLAAAPYVFDTAEQHKIAVSVVARGLVASLQPRVPARRRRARDRTGRPPARGSQRDRGAGADARARPGADRGRARNAVVPDRRPAGSGAAPEVRVEPLGVLHLQQGRRPAADAARRPQVGHHGGPRHVRREGADRGQGRVGRRVPERRQRLPARLRSRRAAVCDDRRAVRSRGAGHQQHLRQGAAAA